MWWSLGQTPSQALHSAPQLQELLPGPARAAVPPCSGGWNRTGRRETLASEHQLWSWAKRTESSERRRYITFHLWTLTAAFVVAVLINDDLLKCLLAYEDVCDFGLKATHHIYALNGSIKALPLCSLTIKRWATISQCGFLVQRLTKDLSYNRLCIKYCQITAFNVYFNLLGVPGGRGLLQTNIRSHIHGQTKTKKSILEMPF